MRKALAPMLRTLRGQSLLLGVSGGALALVQATRGKPPRVLAQADVDGDPGHAVGALFAAVDGSAASLRGWPVTVVLADELARLWQVTPPAACARLADLEATAALRFQQLFGDSAAHWQISADWRMKQPFLAAAAPRVLLAALHQGAGAHGITVVACLPHTVAMAARWRRAVHDGDWFGVVHDGVLALGVCEGGALSSLRAAAVPPAATSGWLSEHLGREALRLNRAAPARVVVCGDAPSAWSGVAGCVLLDDGAPSGWSPAARLALAGGVT